MWFHLGPLNPPMFIHVIKFYLYFNFIRTKSINKLNTNKIYYINKYDYLCYYNTCALKAQICQTSTQLMYLPSINSFCDLSPILLEHAQTIKNNANLLNYVQLKIKYLKQHFILEVN